MSRHSPTGFGFSILLEIAAVVAIVSFLPRIDLRPSSAAAFSQEVVRGPQSPTATPVSQVGWTALDIHNGEATRAASHYERPAIQSAASSNTGSFAAPIAPPFIEANRPDPKYVEDRLDRASQQLVNSVGSVVTTAANNWLPPPKPQPPISTTVQRPRTGSTTTSQPRPWLRY